MDQRMAAGAELSPCKAVMKQKALGLVVAAGASDEYVNN